MVMRLRKFIGHQRGVSLVEGLIAFPVVLVAITTFIEGGVAVYQYNQTAKAVAVGARLLAVSDPLVDLEEITDTFGTLPAGSPVPNTAASASCGPATTTACDSDGEARLLEGTTAGCDAAEEDGVIGMCDVNPAINPDGLTVSYVLSGLGYVGRPNSPVVTIKVQLSGQKFNFFLLGALLGLNNLSMPTQAVTVTSEDLSSTPL